MHFSLSAGLLALSSAASAAADVNFAIGDKVQTASGIIEGHASSWKSQVSEYLGIPFAQPPVGDLRWTAPRKYKSKAVFTASKFSPSCPANVIAAPGALANGTAANILGALAQVGDTFSEDCLTLNVWSKPQSGEKAKAVFVWIYGGGFTSGNSGNPAYNGARLADENDVVVVSVNYRLNIFGFPSVDFLPERNLGLLDQRLAVEWIRDNIAGFGGDPKRIVIAGESAGAASVDYYSYAWTNDPIVSGFIAQSGSATSFPTTYNNEAAWFRVSEKLGCGAENVTSLSLKCMKTKKAVDILDAVKSTRTSSTEGINMGIGEFTPTIDEKIIFSDVTSRRTNGLFVRKPLLVGSNNNEAGLFQVLGPLLSSSNSADSSPSSGTGGLSNLRNSPSVINGQFTCPAADTAKARRQAGVPAWRYRYFGEWPNQNIGANAGAWHGSEVAMVFGTTEYLSKQADIAAESVLGEKMRKAWTDFVKDPVKGLTGNSTTWPIYEPTGTTLVSLGGSNSSAVEFLPSDQFDRQCALVRLVTGGKSGGGGLGGLGGLNLGGLFGAKSNNGTRNAKGGKGGKGGKAGTSGTGGMGGLNLGSLFGAKGTNGTRTGGGKGFQFPKSTNGTRTGGGGGNLSGLMGGLGGGNLGGLLSGLLGGGGGGGGGLAGLLGGLDLGSLLSSLGKDGSGSGFGGMGSETASPKGYNATSPKGLRPLMVRKLVN